MINKKVYVLMIKENNDQLGSIVRPLEVVEDANDANARKKYYEDKDTSGDEFWIDECEFNKNSKTLPFKFLDPIWKRRRDMRPRRK